MKAALVLVSLFILIFSAFGARILAVLPFAGKSHNIFHSTILTALAQRGHHIVRYGPFPPETPIANYTHVEIYTDFEKGIRNWTYEQFKNVIHSDKPAPGVGWNYVWMMTYNVCEEMFRTEQFKKLLSSDEHFDLVITESSFGQESMVVFGHKFKAPVVTLQGFSSTYLINRPAGNTFPISSIPDAAAIIASDQMSFTERFLNFLSTVINLFIYYNIHLPAHEQLIKDNYDKTVPPLAEMIHNVSLYLINAHPTIDYPQSFSPNIIPIAGIGISNERTSLPQSIQKFMDNAKEGVIYFSFGTVVPTHIIPMDILKIFVNVFKKLNYNVIWKIELESIPGLPQNVMLSKWLPQPAVLAHPKCLVFLTHGGLNSQQEAIYAGVPTVGIPFYGDQYNNIKFNEHHKIGVQLEFTSISEETLISALETVLSDPEYRQNAQRLSKIFRDRPIAPVDSAVFWVEYVLRHGGAHHLRPTAAHLAWYQLSLLDVLASILAALLFIIVTLYVVVMNIVNVVLSRIRQKSIISSKKKT